MLVKIYEIGTLVLDIIVLLIRTFIACLESLYNCFACEEKSVAGEVVLITGAGHGIGRELAIQYGGLGSIVVCLDINENGNEETVKILNEMGIKRAHSYKCDVTNREEVLATIEKITKEVGPVTVLINNAGIMPCHKLLDHKPQEIESIFKVNVFAHFWLLEAVLPNMIAKNHGHIVAMSSIAGLVGLSNIVPYCASKFAVRGLMEGLLEETREEGKAPNLKFTCIYPYMVNTGLCKKPKVRFEQAMGLVNPKLAAESIVRAMRRNQMEATIPSFLMALNNGIRLFPPKVGQLVKDFTDSGVEACD